MGSRKRILISLFSLSAMCIACIALRADFQTNVGAATKTRPQAKKDAKIEGFAVAPMVLTDEGCARDYARAFQSEGVELRKKLTELQQYGCVDTSAKGIFAAVSTERKDLSVTKDEVAYFRFVVLTFDYARTKTAIGGEGRVVTPPAKTAYVGWIPDKNFYSESPETFDRLLTEKKIPMTIR